MIGLLAVVGALFQTAKSMPLLSPTFGDHMVLQRGRPNTFWGWAAPGTEVKVSIGTHVAKGVADSSGKWFARISPPPVGGPYVVRVDGPQSVELKDVLVGDVWICSGQSNMEFGIGNVRNHEAEIAAANYPNIRLALLPQSIAYEPQATTTFSWKPCTPASVQENGWGGFSAVAYFFGRELHRRLGVPIGLVETCWGGTIAEAWTSRPSIERFGEFNSQLASVDAAKNTLQPDHNKAVAAWFVQNDPGSKPGSGYETPGFDDSAWKLTPPMPARYEDMDLSKFDGVLWYRKEIDLPDPLPSGDATLELSTIDDMDTTWVNGTFVGSMPTYNADRAYKLPLGLLKPGRNEIVVRCLDTGLIGGFTGLPGSVYLSIGDQKFSLADPWKYEIGADFAKSTPFPVDIAQNPNVATVLYNGMIAPLVPLAIKGAIWYQGESNANRAYQYRRLLPTLISDWRRSFEQGDFPFLIVQLANFTPRLATPGESDWAELREAQAMTARNVKNSGLAVTIDVGDAEDIHPKDKQDVGLRLALAALRTVYGEKIAYSGPVYKAARREGASMRLTFEHTDGGLVAKNDGSSEHTLRGFSIAGSDHKFYWAKAEIQGNTIVVSSPSVPEPVAVRYAWATNPDANLYNGANLPAVPFRTDDWPGVTVNAK